MKVSDSDTASRRKSNYETYASLDGVLRITQFYPLPAPHARHGKTEFELIRSYDTSSNAVYVALRVRFTDDDESVSASILDGDELQSLRQGLAYLTANRDELRNRAAVYTEVDFHSRAGLKIGMYYSPRGEAGEYMLIDGETVFLRSLDDLLHCIDAALATLRHIDPSYLSTELTAL